jgi:hypothetical protein
VSSVLIVKANETGIHISEIMFLGFVEGVRLLSRQQI